MIFFALLFAAAQPYVAYGAGNVSCGAWIKAHEIGSTNPSRYAQDIWLEGFVTGYNVFAPGQDGDVLGGTDTDGLQTYMNTYCAAKPLAPLIEAVINLLGELKRRKSR